LNNDPTKDSRKKDHIKLALASQIAKTDDRFYYEPMLGNMGSVSIEVEFLNKKLSAPLWISSMTGGTAMAYDINHKLAKACKKYGLGMGLGSCRSLLDSDSRFKDFDLRETIGNQPLFANIGIAQIEAMLKANKIDKLSKMVGNLQADGLIVHINPLQEWLQPEGDQILVSPTETLKNLLAHVNMPVIAKEVGQGFGPKSMEALMALPLAAIDFAAHGGTNFSQIEMSRSKNESTHPYKGVSQIGHSAIDMVGFANKALNNMTNIACKNFIISGGVGGFLDGYYLTSKLNAQCIYGQGNAFLQATIKGYDELCTYIEAQIDGLKMAKSFLTIK